MAEIIKPTISANTLFHFTSTPDNLIGILSHEFHPRYHFEYFPNGTGEDAGFAVPMVSFCDLPLSQIKEHLSSYGKYGIGLTKDWGVKNGISPVLYFHKDSASVRLFAEFAKDSVEKMSKESSPSFDCFFIWILRYLKLYQGKMWGKNEPMLFYNEREWRFVPDTNSMYLPDVLYGNAFSDKIKIAEYNMILDTTGKLSFEPSDIKYIVVAKENEVLSMTQHIHQIKEKYNMDTKTILTTKIISAEQILEDF